MITAIVQFKVGDRFSRAEVLEKMRGVAPKFENMPSLVRKNFLFDGEAGIGGGVYTWESREAAEAVFAEGGPWRAAIKELYGAEPEVTYFETPVIVDNVLGKIQTGG